MADIGNDTSRISQEGMDAIGSKAKSAGRKAVKFAGRKVKKATVKLRRRAVKAAGKAAVQVGKTVAGFIAKILAALGPVGIAVLAVIVVLAGLFNFLLDERGSNESNTLDPYYQNPSYLDKDGITKAIALTEPQAVIDAYYKYMACSSFSKTYDGRLWEFQNAEQTEDFAGLRDYNKLENNFYLSDDFIRVLDEALHDERFYYPEQIIKPVFGQLLTLKDKKGNEGIYYTSRLPFDTPDGEMMLNEEKVKNFSDMLGSGVALTAEGATGTDRQLIARSQTPEEASGVNSELPNQTYYILQDHNVIYDDGSVPVESGLWDYGFASVLQYQADQKISYIQCSYDRVDVDFDYEKYEVVKEAEDENGEDVYDWTGPYHGTVRAMSISGSVADLQAACQSLCDEWATDVTRWSYNLPSNINAIMNDETTWQTSVEPNSVAEASYQAIYGANLKNSHIDAKISNAWDSDIDKLAFNDSVLQQDFGNKGGGLYPIKIALCSHAATFSGNIHYTITPAGKEGCTRSEVPLSPNSAAEADHREPVQTIQVAGGCASANLTAHRTGTLITMTPKVEETVSPWGFEYLEQFSDQYYSYAPEDYMNDRDFFVRTGLTAEEGTTQKDEYLRNLSFLMDLGLLRLYAGNITLGATGSADLADLGDSTSDLYILAHLIAAEAGPNKLDELMVGSVFVNRVYSDQFPNTFQEVLAQPDQYACYTDGNYQNAKPTDSEIASAVQVLTGQFAIPDNVLGQSASIQGSIYKTVVNGNGLNTHYYCAMPSGTAVSTVDRYGRPAPSADQLERLAKELSDSSSQDASATAAASLDLSTTAFIGDSLTVGLDSANGLSSKGALVLAEVGNSISQAKSRVESSSALNSNIKTVYLLIGTNSCLDSDASFKDQYQQLLTAIETKTNGARIILTTLPPMRNGTSWNASNAAITQKNAILAEIAASTGYRILDIHSALEGSDGQLKSEYSSDGLHLTNSGYTLWFNKIKSGLTTTDISNPSDSFQLQDVNGADVYSRYSLYEIADFDVLNAVNMQARVAQAESGLKASIAGFFDGIVEFITDTADGLKEFIDAFFEVVTQSIFNTGRSTIYSYRYGTPYAEYDVKSTVYHSIAFSEQILFSTAESSAEDKSAGDDGLMFLFVGKNNLIANGSLSGSSFQSTPGTGTTVDGMISPTDAYYAPLTSYSPTTGYMEISAPAGTNVLAVADGSIVNVGTDTTDAKGQYVTMKTVLNGVEYHITYGYLASVNVTAGNSVSQGDLIGVSGARPDGSAAMYLAVSKDGSTIDPTTIFYQPTYSYGSGSLGGDLYYADGTVDESKISALEAELTASVNAGGGQYHKVPLNTLQYLQCTWWAYGRGFEYLQSIGSSLTWSEYRAAIRGNGGDVAGNNAAAGLFNSGSTPKPNSLVCYPATSGGSGHVAYVEAVDYVNQCYYVSEAGSGNWWGGINKRGFNYAATGSGGNKYGVGIFIYLDEPLK